MWVPGTELLSYARVAHTFNQWLPPWTWFSFKFWILKGSVFKRQRWKNMTRLSFISSVVLFLINCVVRIWRETGRDSVCLLFPSWDKILELDSGPISAPHSLSKNREMWTNFSVSQWLSLENGSCHEHELGDACEMLMWWVTHCEPCQC